MPGVSNQTQLIEFDLAGIAVSTGSACSSGKVGPSHVLAAMGVDPAEAASAIRISLGWASTADDVDRFVDAWSRLYVRTRQAVTDRSPGRREAARLLLPAGSRHNQGNARGMTGPWPTKRCR